MFQRYTEKAKKVIFFSAYEANYLGSSEIEVGHILLGMLHESSDLVKRLTEEKIPSVDFARKVIYKNLEKKNVNPNVGVPLSEEAKKVLSYAEEEADNSGYPYVTEAHLLLGLLRSPIDTSVAIFIESGVNYELMKKQLEEKT